MLRYRCALAALTLAAFALTACSSGAAREDSPSEAIRGDVVVYAAASLTSVFDRMTEAFEEAYPGTNVQAVYDGSSTLATQIAEGAPVDVFASADEANMDKVADLVSVPEPFATNTLVIAVPDGNPADVDDLADLASVTTVLCAPEVPCGAASQKLLAAAAVSVSPVSLEQNVTAVLTKVATGEADAGLVYATDARGAQIDSIVPEGAADIVNRYPIAVLADAPNPDAATAFALFVRSNEGRAILASAGFGAP